MKYPGTIGWPFWKVNEGPTRLYLSSKDGKCFNEYREQCGDNCGLGSRLQTIASSCEHYREFWMGVDSYRVAGTCNQMNPCADNVTTFRDISFLPAEQSLEPATPFRSASPYPSHPLHPRNTMQYEGSFVRYRLLLYSSSRKAGRKKKRDKKESSTTALPLKIIFFFREKRVNSLLQDRPWIIEREKGRKSWNLYRDEFWRCVNWRSNITEYLNLWRILVLVFSNYCL